MIPELVKLFGSIAAIFGGIRWLLRVYFVQQSKLDASRRDASEAESKLFHYQIKEMTESMMDHKAELGVVLDKLELVLNTQQMSRENAQRVYDSLRDFINATHRRFDKLENGSVEVKADKPDKVGKVIVK
jgi:DNA-binding transcriptional regulator GbsR (MarR family)